MIQRTPSDRPDHRPGKQIMGNGHLRPHRFNAILNGEDPGTEEVAAAFLKTLRWLQRDVRRNWRSPGGQARGMAECDPWVRRAAAKLARAMATNGDWYATDAVYDAMASPSAGWREAEPRRAGASLALMRVAGRLLAFYLLVAVGTRLAEAAGVHRCGCADGCWCRRPVLSTFRWVFPFGHRALDAAEKERLQRER